MFQCNSEITITKESGKKISFSFVHSIEIESGYENLTDTCKISIPRKLELEGQSLFNGVDPVFKRGDKIEVKLGYVPNLETVFTGYIRNVGSSIPTILECEDEMYLLKQYKITYPSGGNGGANKTIDDLLKAILKVPYKLIDNLPLNNITFTKVTPSRVLDELKSKYGLFSYFRNGFLHVGFANDASKTNEAEFKMEETIINSDSLEWQDEENISIGVTAINMTSENVKTEATSGDLDGEQKTYHFTGLNLSELQKVADKTVKEFKYTGYNGEVETFGEPIMNHGDRAKITSVKFPEKNGIYLIKKVKRHYGVDVGNHQTFTLGIKVG